MDIQLATRDARCCFEPMRFSRHAPGPLDVTFDVKFCGVCHSDVHAAKGDLLRTTYPLCPGHEIAGVVTGVGARVSKFKVGDHVGVGCFVDSCLECAPCKRGDEQFCSHAGGMTGTYGATPEHGHAGTERTAGGYSTRMVVHEHFAIVLPKSLPLEKAGPLLCAGVTTFSPLKKWRVGPKSRVAVNGLGGLGTMAVKQAKAMGAHVTVITRSARKAGQARAIGADEVIVSADPKSIASAKGTIDLVVDTVSVRHDIQVSAVAPGGLVDILAVDGVWCYCGLILDMQDVQPVRLLMHQIALTGTAIGGIALTQECINFCAQHNVVPETQIIDATPAELSRVFELLDAGNDAGVRYVLDIGRTLNDATFALPKPRAPALVGKARLGIQLAFVFNRMLLAKIEGFVLDRASLVVGALGGALLATIGAASYPSLSSLLARVRA